MAVDFKEDPLYDLFKNKRFVCLDQIRKFYRKRRTPLKNSTLNKRLFDLAQTGILMSYGRGIYGLVENSKKNNFKDLISNQMKMARSLKLAYNKLVKEYPHIKLCIWKINWILPFMHHMTTVMWTIVEAERDVCEAVFDKLQESNKYVLFNPKSEDLSRYGNRHRDAIIVKPMLMEAPMMEVQGVMVPTLEKIIVDLFVDKHIFNFVQGSELGRIYENIFEMQNINFSRLKRYATHRGNHDQIVSYIKKMVDKRFLPDCF